MVRSAGTCFLNQTFALQRPKNGATAIIPKAIPSAKRIDFSFFSLGLEDPSRFRTGRLGCKILHVATVDTPLSTRRTTLDIPPWCYRRHVSGIGRVRPVRQPSRVFKLTSSPKITPCPTRQRSTISMLWARNLPPQRPVPLAGSLTSPTCGSSPLPWATRRPPSPRF